MICTEILYKSFSYTCHLQKFSKLS